MQLFRFEADHSEDTDRVPVGTPGYFPMGEADICAKRRPDGKFYCTREPRHDGAHAAHRGDRVQLATWPQVQP